MEAPSGGPGWFARQWARCRFRIRLLWLALLGYPLLAAAAIAALVHRTEAPIAVPFIVAWPMLVLAAAWWWRAWPCPQCGKPFFYVFPSESGTIFGVKACPWCALPKWATEGRNPAARAEPPVRLAGAGPRPEACWYCGRRRGGGAPLLLNAVSGSRRRDLLVPRCRRCAFAHEVERGMGSVALGFAGFVAGAVLFGHSLDPAAGFGATLLRVILFAVLTFVLTVAGFLAGLPLARPRLWGTRPKADWEQHPEVQSRRAEGWEVVRIEAGTNID
jgi:hypothetical protein